MVKHLIEIQNELKAPKSNYNSFGKYRYRSAEDILTAVKPLLLRYGCQMTLQDDIVAVGDRYYIKATVTITDGTESETVTALAREDEIKKGMDGSQITGTASSYARKYALQGLLGLDDSKAAPVIETDSQSPADHDEEQAISRKTILDQIYALDVTRKELDAFIQSKKPDKDADTVSLSDLRSIKTAIVQKRRNA